MMISGADHRDLSVVCQTQACQLQIVGQQKSGPLHPVGRGGRTHRIPSLFESALQKNIIETRN